MSTNSRRMMPVLLLVVALMVFVGTVSVSAQGGVIESDSPNALPGSAPTPAAIQPNAPQDDRTYGIAASGSYAYLGQGNKLVIVNISNPASPTLAGQTGDLGGTVWDIAISGNYAYVVTGGSALKVVNISNPASPAIIASHDTRGSAEGIAISGNYAYVTDNVGLLVINISNPAAPTRTATFSTPTSYATSVVLSGSYAYVVDALGSGFYIINISNPASPSLAGSYSSGWSADVAVSGAYAHVLTWGSQVVNVLNVSNPANIYEISEYPYAGSKGLRVIGNYSYVSDGDALRIVNVANPYLPTLTGTYSPIDSAWDMVVNGNYAYTSEETGMSIINISNPAAPSLAGFYSTADTTSPTVTWVEPVSATQVATTYGQAVQLRVDATDNIGVTKVTFVRWDHPTQTSIILAEDTSAPYTYSLDSSTLNPGWNQVNAAAYDAAGNVDSEYIWVSLDPPQAPALNTIVNADGDGSYTVSWASSVGATGYKVDENLNNGSWSQIYLGTNLSVSRTGRSAGTWCYRVRATNKAGDGPWSSTTCTTVNPTNQPPNAPSNPNPATGATNVAVTAVLSWSATDPDNDPLTYEVRFGTANPPPQVVAGQTATTYDPPGNLANNTTYYWQIVAKDTAHPSGTAGPVWSFTTAGGPPTFPNVFYISPAANITLGGIAAQGADILRYTKSSNNWTMVYDGSVRGTAKNISAFALTDDGSLLLVFSANQVIAGLGTATPFDVVKFTPNTPGVFPLGAGTYSWFFQGKTKGLATASEKIDALDLVGVRLLLSTTGAASVPLPGGGVLKAADEDAFTYNPTNNEWLTPLRLDGSVVPGLAAEDVNGIWDDPQNDDYYITILGAFNLGGVKGTDKSIVRLIPNGAGGWTPSLVEWLAPGATFTGKIDGLEILR